MMGPGWGMGGGFLVWIVLIAVVGFGIYYVVKNNINNNNNNNFNRSQKDASADAMEIAKERFAKGEITTEEFEEIKKNLL
ncbi:SHOCT domain-containing protein [Planococcus sp. ISL-110]|uniref:SHOCT domain-containing protein n=1 Tax=Planococcus sp. ISL-110 TaxID=2819167 RepID=UPI001BEC73A9|nr:SHOCT domain-containing protein [Planococcus sp. ISL-110]MBT2570096.1 SHOCT domain-containing protein [Planococcus sp. ISL-110]